MAGFCKQISFQKTATSYDKEARQFRAEASDLDFAPGEMPAAFTVLNEKTGVEALFSLNFVVVSEAEDEIEAFLYEMVSNPSVTFKIWND